MLLRSILSTFMKISLWKNLLGDPNLIVCPAIWLKRPFEEDEVFQEILGMAKDKAPGPDRFSMAFYHVCWDVVGEDIMKVFYEFHSFGKSEKSLNATFIALIPKKVVAVEVKDF